MKIKRFQAKTFREALSMVKREMGNDAVILSTEEQKGMNVLVEVTAAVDYELGRKMPHRKTDILCADTIGYGPVSAAPRKEGLTAAVQDDRRYIGELKKDVSMLREMIEEMKGKGFQMALPGAKAEI